MRSPLAPSNTNLSTSKTQSHRFLALLYSAFAAAALWGSAPTAVAQLVPSADGQTVYDAHLQARWLANSNLAATPEGSAIASSAGISTIDPGGAMDYATAVAWVDNLNTGVFNGTVGYLGHVTWTLPTTPTLPAKDPSCTSFNGNGGGSFGYGCTGSDFGSLYNLKASLGLQYPNTSVPIPFSISWPFRNLQPYLYWTGTAGGNAADGFNSFSFSTGWIGTNVDVHYMYVLPMIRGKVTTEYNEPVLWLRSGVGSLQVSADWELIYDPTTQVTWLADADLARRQSFNAQCTNFEPAGKPAFFPSGVPCIAPDGSMSNEIANNWIAGMKAANWLGQSNWELPENGDGCAGFVCTMSELSDLYFNQMGLRRGTPVVPTPFSRVGPFRDIQPYLYWSCSAPDTNPPCKTPPPNGGFEYSFSFGNGFEGTDLTTNNLYVTAYFLQSPAQALNEAIEKALTTSPELGAFQNQANGIISAPDATSKAAALQAFTLLISTQRSRSLTREEATELIALAQLI